MYKLYFPCLTFFFLFFFFFFKTNNVPTNYSRKKKRIARLSPLFRWKKKNVPILPEKTYDVYLSPIFVEFLLKSGRLEFAVDKSKREKPKEVPHPSPKKTKKKKTKKRPKEVERKQRAERKRGDEDRTEGGKEFVGREAFNRSAYTKKLKSFEIFFFFYILQKPITIISPQWRQTHTYTHFYYHTGTLSFGLRSSKAPGPP